MTTSSSVKPLNAFESNCRPFEREVEVHVEETDIGSIGTEEEEEEETNSGLCCLCGCNLDVGATSTVFVLHFLRFLDDLRFGHAGTSSVSSGVVALSLLDDVAGLEDINNKGGSCSSAPVTSDPYSDDNKGVNTLSFSSCISPKSMFEIVWFSCSSKYTWFCEK